MTVDKGETTSLADQNWGTGNIGLSTASSNVLVKYSLDIEISQSGNYRFTTVPSTGSVVTVFIDLVKVYDTTVIATPQTFYLL